MADIDETTDLHCANGLLPSMPKVAGRVALAQRLARRLSTRRGQIPWMPGWGWDIRDALLSKLPPEAIENEIIGECEDDEQVERVVCKASFVGNDLKVDITVYDADGPFEFTIQTAGQAALALSDIREAA